MEELSRSWRNIVRAMEGEWPRIRLMTAGLQSLNDLPALRREEIDALRHGPGPPAAPAVC